VFELGPGGASVMETVEGLSVDELQRLSRLTFVSLSLAAWSASILDLGPSRYACAALLDLTYGQFEGR